MLGSELTIQLSIPCGPEGAAILSALAKAFSAPNNEAAQAADHLAHAAVQQPAAPVTPSAQMAAVGQAAAQGCQQPLPPVIPQASAPVTPSAPPAAVPTTAPDYTQDQLSRAASAYIDKSPANLAQLRGLLQQFGVQAVSQLATPEARTAFANALRGLGAQV